MAKILLVEDDTNLSEIYKARMEAEGYTVIAASDGESALAVAAKEKPDLVISDVMMPKISGFEMLDILRNTDGLKNTPVIMLTALGQADDKGRAEQLGADRYLVKSQVTLEDIVNAAHSILEGESQPAAAAAPSPAPATSSMPVQDSPAPVAQPVQPQPMALATPPASDDQSATPVVQVAAPPDTPDPDTTSEGGQEPPKVQAPASLAQTQPTLTEASIAADEAAAIKQQLEGFERRQVASPAPRSTEGTASGATSNTTTSPTGNDTAGAAESAAQTPAAVHSAPATVADALKEAALTDPEILGAQHSSEASLPNLAAASVSAGPPASAALTMPTRAPTPTPAPATMAAPAVVAPNNPGVPAPTVAPAPTVVAPAAANPQPAVPAQPAPAQQPAAPMPLSTAAIDEKVVATAIEKLLSKTSTAPSAGSVLEHGQILQSDQQAAPVANTGRPLKKIIAPIPRPPQPTLQELVALEEAKSITASQTYAPTPAPVYMEQPPVAAIPTELPAATVAVAAEVPVAAIPAQQPAQPAVQKAFDPNSIAL